MRDLQTMKYFENTTAKITVITATENNYNYSTITNGEIWQKDIQHCFYHDYNIAKKNFQNRNKDTGTSISNGEIWPKDIQHCFYHDCNVVKKKL